MPIVLVHGNPETAAIWDDLRAHLDRADVIALSPPGFGAPLPDGFEAGTDDYLAWLVGELEKIDGPIDLVGHDWGGAHVMRVAMSRPDLLRSWIMDIAGCFDPDYVWHEAARGWQTSEVGEQMVAAMTSAPSEEIAKRFQGLGMSAGVAARVAAAVDADMGKCILSLYRSAAQPVMAEVGEDLDRARQRPGLVIIATEDEYTGGEAMARRSAERAGAEVVLLQGRGHWWMCEDPKQGAQAITAFLSRFD